MATWNPFASSGASTPPDPSANFKIGPSFLNASGTTSSTTGTGWNIIGKSSPSHAEQLYMEVAKVKHQKVIWKNLANMALDDQDPRTMGVGTVVGKANWSHPKESRWIVRVDKGEPAMLIEEPMLGLIKRSGIEGDYFTLADEVKPLSK
jgi:hypothetical protein